MHDIDAAKLLNMPTSVHIERRRTHRDARFQRAASIVFAHEEFENSVGRLTETLNHEAHKHTVESVPWLASRNIAFSRNRHVDC